MKKIYLDHSATTPVAKSVLRKMMPYLKNNFGNASSSHSFGRTARETIDAAREEAAEFLNAEPEEVIFTSGGTESNNLALKGIINTSSLAKPHIIISQIEHHAVLRPIESLEKEKKIEASYLQVDQKGTVNPAQIKKLIKKNTQLISIIYANNEIGTIQPIREIGKIIEKINRKRKNKIYFHTDAVQAAGYLNCDTKHLHLDLLTLTAHKIYGPKGTGVLFVKKGTPLKPEITGGEQEWKKRAGTENVAGIVGLAKAISNIKNLSRAKLREQISRIKKLRDKLETELNRKIPDIIINGEPKNRLPHISSISFPGAEAEAILLMLDQKGIAASAGSACTSMALEPSHVLSAMGISPKIANTTIRFSLGKENSKKEIDYVIKILPNIIKRLRKISGSEQT